MLDHSDVVARVRAFTGVRRPRVLSRVLAVVGLMAVADISLAAAPWSVLPAMPDLPTPSATGKTTVGSAQLWWAKYAAATSRTPVLLLHGGLGSSNYFSLLIPALLADGRPVIVIDSRGQGRSTLGREKLTYARMALDVMAVAGELGTKKADLVGWSDGGIIGLELAIQHPEFVNRLFAFGANADPAGERPDGADSPVFKEYLERSGRDYARISSTPDSFSVIKAAVLAMWDSEPHLTRADLGSIAVPVTIADGQYEEAILPEHVFYMAQAIPRANMVILPNVSHFAMLQQPALFNEAVLSFLRWR